MSHSDCRAIWNDEKKVIILEKDIYARGLTKTLQALFSPEFTFSLAISQHKKKKKHGRAQGNKIDKLLKEWANTGRKPKWTDPYFTCIEQALESKQWVPCSSQVVVACAELRLGTMIDLICRDLNGNIYLIELKCGFDDYWNSHDQGKFKPPFDDISISCRNRAFLQLLFTTYLYLHTQPKNISFGGSHVLHVFEADEKIQYEWNPLPYYFFADSSRLTKALQLLKANKNQNKRQRTKEIYNGAKRARYHAARS